MAVSYIGLGSNIEPRKDFLEGAIKYFQNHPAVTVSACSSFYETAPVGYIDQADFLNMVIRIETSMNPEDLHTFCQEVEEEFERKRTIKWGPRTLDLDILLYDQKNIRTDRLIIPHPRMQERAFVLIPLAEVNPEAWIPSLDKTAAELAKQLPETDKQGVVKWKRKSESGPGQ